MRYFADKIVYDKYEPENTNVVWVQPTEEGAQIKAYIDGEWQLIGYDYDAYRKPASGIPESDLEESVRNAIDNAQHLDGKIDDEIERSERADASLDERLGIVEQLADISISGGDATIATASDFNNPTTEQKAYIPTVGAILDGADTTPTSGSGKLVTSGGVYNVINSLKSAAYGRKTYSKSLTINAGQQSMVTEEFDFGNIVGARIVSNTATAQIRIQWRTGSGDIYDDLTNEWTKRSPTSAINRVYIYANNCTVAGDIVVEVIYKDIARLWLPDTTATISSNELITSGAVYALGESIEGDISELNESIQENINVLGKVISPFFIAYSQANRMVKELYLTGLNSTKRYYFKYLRYLNGNIQARLYSFTQDNHSDEQAVANGDTTGGKLTGLLPINSQNSSGISGFAVYDVQTTDTTTPSNEINVAICSNIKFSPSINCYFLENRSVTTSMIEDKAVTNGKIAIGAVMQNSISDKSVNPRKTDFFVLSDNLFDKSSQNAEDGYVNGAGAVSPHSSYKTSGYIPVEAGAVYYLTPANISGVQARCLAFYYDNFNYIPRSYLDISTQATAPTGAAYMRVTYANGLWGSGQVTKGTQKNYMPFGYINSDYIDISSITEIIPTPVVSLPSVVYAFNTQENSIYHKNYATQINFPYFVTAPAKATSWKYLDRCFRNDTAGNGNLSITIKKNTAIGNNTVNSFAIPTAIGLAATNNGAKVINCIGDSFTYNGKWFDYINTICPSLSFVGMRKSYDIANTLRAEGRGGWSLSAYFSPHDDVTPTHMQPFSPFMHPANYRYYGVLEFWAAIVNDNSQYSYGTNGFDDYKSWFNTSGYKINPSANDMMYDGTNDKYIYYNGSSWVDYSGTPTFVFDYAKYISTWNITSPDYVIVMLGVNDFFNGMSSYTEWNEKMNTLIDSVQSYAQSVSKVIKIGICTNTTAPNSKNSSNYQNPLERHLNLFYGRKNIIDTFDTSEYKSENVFVIDSGACLDPDYGFALTSMKPFEFYDGSETELFDTNGVHPSAGGYKQLGVCVAGFIQYTR